MLLLHCVNSHLTHLLGEGLLSGARAMCSLVRRQTGTPTTSSGGDQARPHLHDRLRRLRHAGGSAQLVGQ
eukprot:445441-Alexandrium_andersonii.AAC.1